MGWNLENRGDFAIVALSAPPNNNVSLRSLGELEQLLWEVSKDDQVKLVVLTGDPAGSYLGHADLGDVAAVRAGTVGPDPFERWVLTPLVLEDIAQPVIAAIDGPARNGGCELALACTFRVGSPEASFAQLEITRNAMPGAGGTQRLPKIIGLSRAARVIMSGEAIGSREALGLGLLDHVVDQADFIDGVLAWAEPMARHPREALAAIKRALIAGSRGGGAVDNLIREHRLFHQLLRSEASKGRN